MGDTDPRVGRGVFLPTIKVEVRMSANPPETQLNEFIDRYTHDIAEDAREILARMREWLPGTLELVYDN